MRPRNTLACLLSLCVASATLAHEQLATQIRSLDGDDWLIAPDPGNVGREEAWFTAQRPDGRPIRVPWILESVLPDYSGLVWYYKRFTVPANPHQDGRTLLRFWAVDFQADVWLNGVPLGGHTGSETPFVLDATSAVRPLADNVLAVRVLKPTDRVIDGIHLNMTPRGLKTEPHQVGLGFNHGGILDSVELLLAPAVRVTDVFAVPDVRTGEIRVETSLYNSDDRPLPVELEVSLAPASSGATLLRVRGSTTIAPGTGRSVAVLRVEQPRRWDLNDPFLYRVTVACRTAAYPDSCDEASVRTGFREFTFDDGYFRFNGRRLFLRCSHTCNHAPIGLRLAHDPDLYRRDLINAKMMGFNAIRFIAGMPTRQQLDLADELGLLVYEECQAAWVTMLDSPHFATWYDNAIREMILRDRNHPSVVIWGLLNECASEGVNRHAADALQLVRSLDDSRMVFFNSGRWDLAPMGGFPASIACRRRESSLEPFVARNDSNDTIDVLGIIWEPGVLATHPGPQGEYGVVRWTAPRDLTCAIQVQFSDITAQTTTTDVHLLHNGRSLFTGGINVHGGSDRAEYHGRLDVAQGDVLDVAVGWGNNHYGGDTTAVQFVIQTDHGEFHAACEFTVDATSHGPWSYGMFAAADRPDWRTFTPFAAVPENTAGWGTFCNPGSSTWSDALDDHHPYQRVPHTADIIEFFRTVGAKPYAMVNSRGGGKPYFPSEYGIGSGVNWPRMLRQFEQYGDAETPDRRFYQAQYDQFAVDYQRWKMNEVFGRHEDFFQASLERMAQQRTVGLNALRSNPAVVGYSLTGTVDQVMGGEGLWTTFRELKPGTTDAMFDGLAPLRWCTFVEPVNVYSGDSVTLDVVLANEDALRPGSYPARLWVFDPLGRPVHERQFEVVVDSSEAPFAVPAHREQLMMEGPTGRYRLVVAFERGGAATGGETEFHVFHRADMPRVEHPIVLWGEDAELEKWLDEHAIKYSRFDPAMPLVAQAHILATQSPPAPGGKEAFAALMQLVEQGAHVVFLCPEVFRDGADSTAHLPVEQRGRLGNPQQWLYHIDQWAKRHCVFDGLQAGGLMDYGYYREILPESLFIDLQTPEEAIAGGNNASLRYESGLMTAVFRRGEGRFLINTLLIREQLGKTPQAERLLRNMLNWMATAPETTE